MAITQVKGTYHNMPVIFHQEDGRTVKITPGSFCPRCQETRYRIIDEGFIECYTCGRSYFVPSQEQIDAVVPPEGFPALRASASAEAGAIHAMPGVLLHRSSGNIEGVAVVGSQ